MMADTSKVIYRRAEEDDWIFIEEMLLDLAEELNDQYDIQEVRDDVERYRRLPNLQCYVAEHGHPIGCAAFFCMKEMGKKTICAHESFWYVEPEYRKGVGKELVNFVEKNINCDSIEFGIADPRLLAMMERSGYVVIKSIVKKDL